MLSAAERAVCGGDTTPFEQCASRDRVAVAVHPQSVRSGPWAEGCDVLHLLQLRSSHLKSRVMQKSLQPLKALLDGSSSSLTVPYVLHEVSDAGSYG